MLNAGPVLHLDSSHAWGGGQNQVRLLMRGLAQAGIRQLCLCPRGSPLAQRLAEAGLPVEPIRWRGGSDPRAFFAIARRIADFNIVHCHDAHALQLALAPAKLRGVRIVAARRVRFATSAFKWNRADIIIAVSQTVRAQLIGSGIDARRIRVIHSGTDSDETRAVPLLQPRARVRCGIPANAFVVGSAAAFFEAKGQTLIPQAAALLPDVHWLIAGEGPTRAAIEANIAGQGVEDRVHLLGWLADARPLFKELDAYVSTSTDDGLGNSITECLALHVPVIAAHAGGPAEILEPVHAEAHAVLFEPRNAQALAAAVAQIRDAGTRARIVEAQDRRFHDFDIAITVAATLAVYRGLAAQ